eukprot:symbB.v1.2.002455.t1/scaffold99.1/size346285/11
MRAVQAVLVLGHLVPQFCSAGPADRCTAQHSKSPLTDIVARAGNTCSEIAFCHGPKSKGGTWWNLSLDEDEDDEDDKEDVDEKDEEEDDEDKEDDENDEEDEAEEDETDEEDEDVDEDEDDDDD